MTITFTLSALLIPYGLIIAVVAVFAAFNLRHLIEHGPTVRVSYGVTLTFLAGVAVILILTWQGLGRVDWRQPISLTPPETNFGAPAVTNTNTP